MAARATPEVRELARYVLREAVASRQLGAAAALLAAAAGQAHLPAAAAARATLRLAKQGGASAAELREWAALLAGARLLVRAPRPPRGCRAGAHRRRPCDPADAGGAGPCRGRAARARRRRGDRRVAGGHGRRRPGPRRPLAARAARRRGPVKKKKKNATLDPSLPSQYT